VRILKNCKETKACKTCFYYKEVRYPDIGKTFTCLYGHKRKPKKLPCGKWVLGEEKRIMDKSW